jgi:hypothetical protein
MDFLYGILLTLLTAGLLTIIGYFVAHLSWFKFMRPMYCHTLPWHSRRPTTISHDGCSVHARCRWCGYEGMIDSQGNLF